MAFRIHDSVVRGEIDNRAKGVVRGQIWLVGREQPLTLELRGNAQADLAGCLLTFKNPRPALADPRLDALHSVQCCTIGDLTASRKVRVPSVPMEEFLHWPEEKGPPPSHWANSLYLEWFSEANGRVVIESADYELTLSTPEWRLSPEDEAQRGRDAAAGMAGFTARLTAAIERHQRGQKDPEAEWDEHDYERFLKESDARTDKYMELLDKYGHSDAAEQKIAEEMGWTRELTEEEAEEEQRHIEEINAACEAALHEPEPEPDPHREGLDWIRTEDGDLSHPLQHRCQESALRFWHQVDELEGNLSEDPDVEQFITEFQITSAKLAGALCGVVRGGSTPDGAFTVAYLKRALDHLHRAQAGLEAAARRTLLPETLVVEARKELLELRTDLLNLMDQFRGRT